MVLQICNPPFQSVTEKYNQEDVYKEPSTYIVYTLEEIWL